MGVTTDELYNKYQNLPDEAIMNRFAELIQLTNRPEPSDQNAEDLLPEMNVVMQVMKEKNLSFSEAMQKKLAPKLKNDAKESWYNGVKKGSLNLLIGIGVLGLGLTLSSASEGKVLFYGAIIFGAVEILVGLSILGFLTYERIKYPDDF